MYESITPSQIPLNTQTQADAHTHTAYSGNNQQLPGSAPLLLLSHNCSRASPLLVLVCLSQAANHQQPSWLAAPPASNRPLMESIVSTKHTAQSSAVYFFFLPDLFIYGPQDVIVERLCSVDRGRGSDCQLLTTLSIYKLVLASVSIVCIQRLLSKSSDCSPESLKPGPHPQFVHFERQR